MVETVYCLDFATNVELLRFKVKVIDSWVVVVIGSEDLYAFIDFIWFIDILDYRVILETKVPYP